jgi:hypothetical protein
MPKPPQSDSTVGPGDVDELVKAAVSNNIAEWAKIVGLTPTDAQFDRFRGTLTGALHMCVRAHIDPPNRTNRRAPEVRKDFSALAKASTAAAKNLSDVEAIRARLPLMYHRAAFNLAHPPLSVAFELEGLAAEARRYAMEWVDSSGQKRTKAFRALAQGLEQAIRQSTGRPASVNWNEHRDCYEGVFFDLVEITLLTVREVARAVADRPLWVPETAVARGKFLQRLKPVSRKDKTRHK